MLSDSKIWGVFNLNWWSLKNHQGGDRKVEIIKFIVIPKGIEQWLVRNWRLE